MTQTTLQETKTECTHNDQTLDYDKLKESWFWLCNKCGEKLYTSTTPTMFLMGVD